MSTDVRKPPPVRMAPAPTWIELTAQAVLRETGLGRLRVMVVAMLLLVQVGIIAATLLSADLVIKRLAWGSLFALLVLFAWIWLRLEAERTVNMRTRRAITIPLCVAVVVANFAFGLVSTFCAAVTLGLMLFSSSSGRNTARLAYSTIAIGYLVAGALVRAGVAYRPLVPTTFAASWQWDAGIVTVELLYFAAYVSGRMMRREHARVVRQFERAVRDASHRQALLREARDAFKKAAGLGGPGRFTDHDLDGYRLGVVIGRGGMGEVYAAEHLEQGTRAAIKLLRLDFLSEKSALSRFEREAKIVASIRSPHVVKVLAVSGPDAVFPYIAMERLEGVDLASHLRDRGRLPLPELVELIRQIAEGLDAAHRANVVHRDLKPNNVFRELSPDGDARWKILDFGVSKLLGSGEISLTAAELIGTPQYMSPEQVRGERDLDHRTDVYALAAIAYRALTGEPPFTGELPAILRTIDEAMPAAPSSLVPVHEDLDLVLAVGLAKPRQQRFESARALASALARAAEGALSERLRIQARALLAERPYEA